MRSAGYRRLGRDAESEKHLTRYEQLQTTPIQGSIRCSKRLMRANQQMQIKRHLWTFQREALKRRRKELETALQSQPWLISARANLIALYFQIGQPRKRNALPQGDGDRSVGCAAQLQLGRDASLQNNLDEATKAYPDMTPIRSMDAHAQLGEVLWRQEKREQPCKVPENN
jgi:hypothetical protein